MHKHDRLALTFIEKRDLDPVVLEALHGRCLLGCGPTLRVSG